MMAMSRIQDEVLQCTICYNTFQTPKTLPCLHTFCQECLSTYIRGVATKAGFQCPICRDHVKPPAAKTSPAQWASLFKTNFHLDKLKNAIDEGDVGERKKTGQSCTEHPQAQLDLFCVACAKAICHLCSGIFHRNCHLVMTLQEVVEDGVVGLQKIAQQMSKTLQKSRDDVSRVKKQLERVSILKEECRSEVEDYTASLIRVLKEREVEILHDIEQKYQNLKDKVDLRIDNFRQQQSNYYQELVNVKSVAASRKSASILKMFPRISSNIPLLETSEMSSLSEKLEKVDIRFIPALSDKQIGSLLEIGVIVMERSVCDTDQKSPRVAFQDDHHVTLNNTHNSVAQFSKKRSNTLTHQPTGSSPITKIGNKTQVQTILSKQHQDEHPPRLIDIVVLEQEREGETNHTILVTDWNNECVKSYRCRRGRDSRLAVGGKPWCITALSKDTVAISIPRSQQICVLKVSQTLMLLSSVVAQKKYSGLAAIDKNTLVACGSTVPPSVDIINVSGEVLKSFSFDADGSPLFSYPAYVCITPSADVIVSDKDNNSLTCLNQDGGVVWCFKPQGTKELDQPAGVHCNARGEVFFVEERGMLCLTAEGQLKGPVLRRRDGIESPKGVFISKYETIFFTQKEADICLYKPRQASVTS